jgi:hypothetical protein
VLEEHLFSASEAVGALEDLTQMVLLAILRLSQIITALAEYFKTHLIVVVVEAALGTALPIKHHRAFL